MSFADVSTATVAELEPGDFVVEVPSQNGYRGRKVNSGLRDLKDDFGTWRKGPPRRKTGMKSRILMFLDHKAGSLNLPNDWVVTVRKKTGDDDA